MTNIFNNRKNRNESEIKEEFLKTIIDSIKLTNENKFFFLQRFREENNCSYPDLHKKIKAHLVSLQDTYEKNMIPEGIDKDFLKKIRKDLEDLKLGSLTKEYKNADGDETIDSYMLKKLQTKTNDASKKIGSVYSKENSVERYTNKKLPRLYLEKNDRWDKVHEYIWKTLYPPYEVRYLKNQENHLLEKIKEIYHHQYEKLNENSLLAKDKDLNTMYIYSGLEKFKSDRSQSSTEENKLIEEDEFFETILNSSSSDSKVRIAIVGDAGGGKTTFLSQIGKKLIENAPVIWISFKDIKDDYKLGKHLCKVWLPDILEQPTHEDESKIKSIIKQKNAWILLDGLDEYKSENYCDEFSLIESWIQSANTNIVVSCRTHIWQNQIWRGYEAYRLLEFKNCNYEKYIEKYFDGDCSLIDRLKEDRNSHLKDLVKNPLLLAITCFVYQKDKELPNTKYKLYELYLFKLLKRKDKSQKLGQHSKQLHKILGISCRYIIDGKKYLPKFDEEFIRQACKDFRFYNNEINELLDIAEKAGWIKSVQDEIHSEYQFFHKTFQEYFAASYIDDWDFFLPEEHDNNEPSPVEDKKYRVFEDKWQEVIEFWIGKCQNEYKDEGDKFIEKLVNFKDGLSVVGFYQNRCLNLVGGYIKEFKDCYLNRSITEADKVDFYHDYKIINKLSYFDKEESIEKTVRLQTIIKQYELSSEESDNYYSNNIISYWQNKNIDFDIADKDRKAIELSFWYENYGHWNIEYKPCLYDWISFTERIKRNLFASEILLQYYIYVYEKNERFFEDPCFNNAMIEELDHLGLLAEDSRIKVKSLKDLDPLGAKLFHEYFDWFRKKNEADYINRPVSEIFDKTYFDLIEKIFNYFSPEENSSMEVWNDRIYWLPCEKEGDINIDTNLYNKIGNIFFEKYKIAEQSINDIDLTQNLIDVLTSGKISFLTHNLLTKVVEYFFKELEPASYSKSLTEVKKAINDRSNSQVHLLIEIAIHFASNMSYPDFYKAWNSTPIVSSNKRYNSSSTRAESFKNSSNTSQRTFRTKSESKSRKSKDFEL